MELRKFCCGCNRLKNGRCLTRKINPDSLERTKEMMNWRGADYVCDLSFFKHRIQMEQTYETPKEKTVY